MKIKGSSKVVRIILILLWLLSLLGVYIFSLRYSIQTEKKSISIQETDFIKNHQRIGESSLFFFVHPKCSCTLASIEELKNILKVEDERFRLVIVISVRSSVDNDFMNTESVGLIKKIKNAELIYDIGSIETQKLGVTTSGHVLYYGPEMNLLYSGGITASRGHIGDSIAKFELLKRIKATSHHGKFISDVYGCGFGGKAWR